MPRGSFDPKQTRLLYRICDLFFTEKKKVAEIASTIKQEFGRPCTREQIYPLLAKARDQGLIRLVPPLEDQLPRALAEQFQHDPASITVVDLAKQGGALGVAFRAAEVVLMHIKELLRRGRKPVGLGLGPGRASLEVSSQLAELMRSDEALPHRCVSLHAITGGGPPDEPEYAPNSFFNVFPKRLVDHCVGLFAEILVPCKQYRSVIQRASVSRAFERREDIDIVITSRGAVAEQHDLYCRLLKQEGQDIEALQRRGWIGNVQYRPYSDTGPITEERDAFRAVTLFELADFVELARRKDKHVILIARCCSVCGEPQARSLWPLMTVRELKVWSHLLMDISVATELLDQANRSAAP